MYAVSLVVLCLFDIHLDVSLQYLRLQPRWWQLNAKADKLSDAVVAER